MALFSTLSTVLTAKATAGVAAAVLAGAGLSVAADTVDTPRGEAEERRDELNQTIDEAPDADVDMDANLQGEVRADQTDEVHARLTTEGEVRPGEDGFGQAVAEHARDRAKDAGGRAADLVLDGEADGRAAVGADASAGGPAAAESGLEAKQRADAGAGAEGSAHADAGNGSKDVEQSDDTARIEADADHTVEAGVEQSVTVEPKVQSDAIAIESEAEADASFEAEITGELGLS